MVASHGGYEVVLGPAAVRVLEVLRAEVRDELADALRTDLLDGPNAAHQIGLRFDSNGIVDPGVPGEVDYTVTPLSVHAYTAIHRPLRGDELAQLRSEQHRPVDGRGCYVLDILPAELGFRRPRLA